MRDLLRTSPYETKKTYRFSSKTIRQAGWWLRIVAGLSVCVGLNGCGGHQDVYDLARRVIQQISDQQERPAMQEKLVESLIRSGQYNRALVAVEEIEGAWQVTSRVTCSLAAHRRGDENVAKRELAKALVEYGELSDFRKDVAERKIKLAKAIISQQADELGTALAGAYLASEKFDEDNPEAVFEYLETAEKSGDLSAIQSAVEGYLTLARRLGADHAVARKAVTKVQGWLPQLPGLMQLDNIKQYMRLLQSWGDSTAWQLEMDRLESEFLMAKENPYLAFRISLLMADEYYAVGSKDLARESLSNASALAETIHVADDSVPYLEIGLVMHQGGDGDAPLYLDKAVVHAFAQPGFFKPIALATICLHVAEFELPLSSSSLSRIHDFAGVERAL